MATTSPAGYVTVDTVNNCTLRFPSDIGYFGAGGTGDATNQNVLWGDYIYSNPAANRSSAATLVHIEASSTNPETSTAGQYTFYGRYVSWSAADNREPLATRFAARFANVRVPSTSNGAAGSGTSLVAWRDSKVVQNTFKCGQVPSWYPLVRGADRDLRRAGAPAGAANLPGLAAAAGQRHQPVPGGGAVDGPGWNLFPVPFHSGWVFLDLNTTVTPAGSVPPEDRPPPRPGWRF